jgi:50S ribosomal protein L4
MKRSFNRIQRFFSTGGVGLPSNINLDPATKSFLEAQAVRDAAAKQALALKATPQPLRLPVLKFALAPADASSTSSSSSSSSTSSSSAAQSASATLPSHIGNDVSQQGRFVDLDPVVFTTEIRRDIIHRVVVWQEQKARRTLYKAKTRSEVRGGGIKPWKQKGLGKARASSIRSPLWVGGGVAHPPKLRHWGTLLQVKVRRLGMRIALAAKFRDNRLLIVDKLALNNINNTNKGDVSTSTTSTTTESGVPAISASRTKVAVASLSRLGIPAGSRVLFVDDGSSSLSCRHPDDCGCDEDDIEESGQGEKMKKHAPFNSARADELVVFRTAIANIPKTKILPHIGANVRDLISADYVIFEEEALARVVERVKQ